MEIIQAIGNFGILVVIAGVFLYEHFTSDKHTQKIQEHNSKILQEMKVSNENTAKALEIMKHNQEYTINITERIEKKLDNLKENTDISKKKEGK